MSFKQRMAEQYIRDLKADGACSCHPVIKLGHVYHEWGCIYFTQEKGKKYWGKRNQPPLESSKGKQTWWGSIVEAKANILVGCIIAYISNITILPLFGFDTLTHAKNFGIVVIYTIISVIRQLVVRRFFNNLKWGHHK